MKKIIEQTEKLLAIGGIKKDIVLIVISGIFLLLSILGFPLPFNPAWVAIIFCGVPIILEAIISGATEI